MSYILVYRCRYSEKPMERKVEERDEAYRQYNEMCNSQMYVYTALYQDVELIIENDKDQGKNKKS